MKKQKKGLSEEVASRLTKKLIEEKHIHSRTGGSIKEFVLGVEDGLVSNLGLVSGFAGAAIGSPIIILAGIIEMLAGAISMSAGTYLGQKSQREVYEREFDKSAIDGVPKIAESEIRKICMSEGMKGKELEKIVKKMISQKEVLTELITKEEYDVIESKLDSPIKSASVMGFSFIVGALIPILPYFFITNVYSALGLSIIFTVLSLFVFGAFKTLYTGTNWVKSGFEMMIVGVIASLLGYIIGNFIGNIL